MTTKHFLVGLILTLVLIGCVRSGASDPIETPTPAPLTSSPAVDEFFITYRRSGGFVGANDTWTIDPQGKVAHQGSGASVQLTTAQLAELITAVRTANFMDLKDSYLPEDTCCDRYEYTITIAVNGQSKTVRAIDASPTAPSELMQLIETLNRYVPPSAPVAQ